MVSPLCLAHPGFGIPLGSPGKLAVDVSTHRGPAEKKLQTSLRQRQMNACVSHLRSVRINSSYEPCANLITPCRLCCPVHGCSCLRALVRRCSAGTRVANPVVASTQRPVR
eukprot:568596-Rhodomonas_salina.1